MELREFPIMKFPTADFDMLSAGGVSGGAKKPYIQGHVTDGSTFTFQVNGSDVSVSVDANGNWKYKPTATITSLAFVGVPELDSLTLCKINGLQTFNLDYPVVPTFKNCDATTEAALNYVYHIRGTATDDFQFTLKYVDDNNTVTTVTESAVIDENGKWDVAYSGKKIKELNKTFMQKDELLSVEITENCNKVTSVTNAIYNNANLEEVLLKNADFIQVQSFGTLHNGCFGNNPKLKKLDIRSNTFINAKYISGLLENDYELTDLYLNQNISFDKVLNADSAFRGLKKLCSIDLKNATFEMCTSMRYIFYLGQKLQSIDLSNINVLNTTDVTGLFNDCDLLQDLYVSTDCFYNDITFASNPLSYDSMLRVAGWLADLTNEETQTVTFKKETYDALTAEQKATLEGIIVTQKHWNLATA